MTHYNGTLEVTIVQGRYFKDDDVVGINDAYIEIYLDKDYKQRTTTVRNSSNTTWNQIFTSYLLLFYSFSFKLI